MYVPSEENPPYAKYWPLDSFAHEPVGSCWAPAVAVPAAIRNRQRTADVVERMAGSPGLTPCAASTPPQRDYSFVYDLGRGRLQGWPQNFMFFEVTHDLRSGNRLWSRLVKPAGTPVVQVT